MEGGQFFFFLFFFLLLFSHSLHVLHTSAPYHAASAAMRDELAISAGPGTAVYSAEQRSEPIMREGWTE